MLRIRIRIEFFGPLDPKCKFWKFCSGLWFLTSQSGSAIHNSNSDPHYCWKVSLFCSQCIFYHLSSMIVDPNYNFSKVGRIVFNPDCDIIKCSIRFRILIFFTKIRKSDMKSCPIKLHKFLGGKHGVPLHVLRCCLNLLSRMKAEAIYIRQESVTNKGRNPKG